MDNEASNVKKNQYMSIYDNRSRFVGFSEHSFKDFRDFLADIIPVSVRVLDYGCGHGSLGFLGHQLTSGITVDGFDVDVNNAMAAYHDRDGIKGSYDYIILSHILEHCNLDECREILEWCRVHGDNLVIVLPNTSNPFMNVLFYTDLTHVRPYDNDDFLSYIEHLGFEVKRVVRCDIVGLYYPGLIRIAARFLFNVLMGMSPFYDYFIVCQAKK